MNAAARPRPSNIPPAATTGIGDELREEIHRTDDTAIAAGLAALRDNDVSATLRRFDRLRNRRDLDHYFRADVVGLPHQIAGIPERERYGGSRSERVAECTSQEVRRNGSPRRLYPLRF